MTIYFRSDDENDVSRSKTDDIDQPTPIPPKCRLPYTDLICDMIKPLPNPAYGHFESFAYAQ